MQLNQAQISLEKHEFNIQISIGSSTETTQRINNFSRSGMSPCFSNCFLHFLILFLLAQPQVLGFARFNYRTQELLSATLVKVSSLKFGKQYKGKKVRSVPVLFSKFAIHPSPA